MDQPGPDPAVDAPARRRRGRRTGGEDTREQIVAAARSEFVERGYAAASVRGIARRAGVDPGLVRYWFEGGKAELLTNSLMHPAVNPAGMVDLVLDGPVEAIGSRLVAMVLSVWEMPGGPERFRLVFGAAVTGEDSGAVRDYIAEEVLAKVALVIPGPDARLRVSLAASHLFGLLAARFVLKLEPLASAPVPDLVKWAGPTVQRYFEVTEPAVLDPMIFAGPQLVARRAAAEASRGDHGAPADAGRHGAPADAGHHGAPADAGRHGAPDVPGALGPLDKQRRLN